MSTTTQSTHLPHLAGPHADRPGELDLASQDVVIEVVRALEEQLWMIRAQFPDR